MKHRGKAAQALVLIWSRFLSAINQEQISLFFLQFDLAVLLNHLANNVIFLRSGFVPRIQRISAVGAETPRGREASCSVEILACLFQFTNLR